MYNNNDRGATRTASVDELSSDEGGAQFDGDLALSMSRTSAGRWTAPADKPGTTRTRRADDNGEAPHQVVDVPSTGVSVNPEGRPQDSVHAVAYDNGAEPIVGNGRWVPDPTVQLQTRSLGSAVSGSESRSNGLEANGQHDASVNGHVNEVANGTGLNAHPQSDLAANGHSQMYSGNPEPFSQPDPNGMAAIDRTVVDGTVVDGTAAYNDVAGHAPGFGVEPFGAGNQIVPPTVDPYGGFGAPAQAEANPFGYTGFDHTGLDGGVPGSNGHQVAGYSAAPEPSQGFGPGQGPAAAPNGYSEPPHNPYEQDVAFGSAGPFASAGGFDGAGSIDAVDTAGRNFDEEELETGMAARRNAIEWAVVLVAAVLLALVLRAVLLQAFYIPSPSMEDTLLVDDRVLVNKLSYRLNDISLGDIVVFHRTEAEIAASGPDDPKDVIKRVIATEGQRIEIRENQVFINDQLLLEPYLDPNVSMADFGPQIVPEGHIFVMGDNRNLSSDSRGETGPVAEERVVGRAFFLFWPLNRLSAL